MKRKQMKRREKKRKKARKEKKRKEMKTGEEERKEEKLKEKKTWSVSDITEVDKGPLVALASPLAFTFFVGDLFERPVDHGQVGIYGF